MRGLECVAQTHGELELQGSLPTLVSLLHFTESFAQVSRVHLSVSTSDCLQDGIVDEDVLVL